MFSAGQTWTVARRNFATVLQKVAQVIGGEQCVPFPATLGYRGREGWNVSSCVEAWSCGFSLSCRGFVAVACSFSACLSF